MEQNSYTHRDIKEIDYAFLTPTAVWNTQTTEKML